MNINIAISNGSKILKNNFIPSPKLDSEILMAKTIKKDRNYILLNPTKILKKNELINFYNLIKERSLGNPVAYLTNKKNFWNSDFIIDKNVLDPRPDSESLIEVALNLISKPSRILDLGTGSGCLACSLLQEFPRAKVVAIDKCPKALNIAKRNAENLNLSIDFINSDWTNSIKGKFIHVYGGGNYYRNYIHINDLVNAFLVAGTNTKINGMSLNVGSTKSIKFIDVCKIIKNEINNFKNKKIKLISVKWPKNNDLINKRKYVLNCNKFKKLTRWNEKIKIKDGVRSTIKLFKK